MPFAGSSLPTDDRNHGRALRHGLAIAWIGMALFAFALTGCEDDPILSPGNVEDTGTGGSYGRLSVPGETDRENETPPRSGDTEAERTKNPERF